MFKYWIYKFGQFCVRRLSIRWAYRIACMISDLHYLFSWRDRRAVRKNLKTILGTGQNIEPLVREVFRNFGKYLVEFFRMEWEASQEFIQQNVRLVNIERIDEALRRRKGIIILTAHIGNWELGGVVLSTLGYPSLAITLPHKERPVNDLFNAQREVRGVQVVSISQAIRKCLEHLKANKLVAVLADRDFTASGERMSFLGRMAFIPKGAAVFAARTGAAILPIFFVRGEDNTFTLIVEEPIYASEVANGEDNEEVIRKVMQEYTAVIERKIHEYPTQWMMFREFWEKMEPIGRTRSRLVNERSSA